MKREQSIMRIFRRTKGTNKWHWCKNCSGYPRWKYDELISDKPPFGKLCNECIAKEIARNCKKC